MAYLELSMTLAKTLWYYDFEVAPGNSVRLERARAANFASMTPPHQLMMSYS